MNRLQLIRALDSVGVRQTAYSLNGPSDLAICLEKMDSEWSVYYSERGVRNDEQRFENESDACQRVYDMLLADRTAYK